MTRTDCERRSVRGEQARLSSSQASVPSVYSHGCSVFMLLWLPGFCLILEICQHEFKWQEVCGEYAQSESPPLASQTGVPDSRADWQTCLARRVGDMYGANSELSIRLSMCRQRAHSETPIL
ncbi:hypothetical protein CBL_13435 [Carabus blaptoides fortunei]